MAPVTGETPVFAITDTGEYTATVSWNGSPSTFAPSTAYTATITITPDACYTLTGVVQDFFTVAEATTVSNAADSGVVTALFPATAAPIAPIQTTAPTITTPIYATDTSVSGTAVPGASISLAINGGTAQMATADETTGAWTVTGLILTDGDHISVTAILSPDTLSNPATATVAAAVQTAYTVTYDGNGNDEGNVPTGSHTYDWGATVTVLNNTGSLSKTGCTFTGWNTDRSGRGIPYAAGNVFSITSNAVTLYAQWEVSNVVAQSLLPPEISPDSGGFTGSRTVTISDPNPSSISVDDAAYYTLNNTMPTLQSCKCKGLPFTFALDQSAEVSAAVYNQVYGWSQPACVTYTLIIPTSVPYQTISTSAYAPPTTISFGNSSGSCNTVSLNTLLTAPSSNTTVPLPPLVIQSGTSPANSIVVSIYAGTTISASSGSNWNGSINAPTDQSTSSVTVVPDQGDTASVDSVIEIGAGNTPLTFNQPVQILFPGLAGKHVGYYQNSIFTEISPMSPDSVADLGPNQSGYYDSGADLVVWTTHFTQYVIYTETAIVPNNNTGGGGRDIYPPTVQTEAASTVTANSAVLNGDITSDNGYDVTAYGFLWGTNSSSLTNKLDVGANNQSGTFTDTLSILTTGTTYYFQAYATNSQGTADGVVLSFTAGAETPTTLSTPSSAVPVFSDVPSSYWGYDAISGLGGKEIISGYPDGTFKPDAAITRAEFCTVMDRVLNLTTFTQQIPTFIDVNTGDWFDQAVESAVYAGIAKGYGDGTFHPNAPISRQEIACVLVQALGKQSEAQSNVNHKTGFTDDASISSWARGFVAVAVNNGLLKGYPDNSFMPQGNATRAETCAMIVNFLNAQP
jgi:uncharacterized repeat protein (TIGR02543 family)